MSELTRRDFIKLAGAAAAMTALPGSAGAAERSFSAGAPSGAQNGPAGPYAKEVPHA